MLIVTDYIVDMLRHARISPILLSAIFLLGSTGGPLAHFVYMAWEIPATSAHVQHHHSSEAADQGRPMLADHQGCAPQCPYIDQFHNLTWDFTIELHTVPIPAAGDEFISPHPVEAQSHDGLFTPARGPPTA